MSAISEANLVAARHMGWTQHQHKPDWWYKTGVNGIYPVQELPRPDENWQDAGAYLEFVLAKPHGHKEYFVKVMESDFSGNWQVQIDALGWDGEPWQAFDMSLCAAICAACNAAMRSLVESEAQP